jgi:plastocyanin
MIMGELRGDRRAIGNGAIAGIVVVILVIAAAGYFFVTSQSGQTSTASSTTISSSATMTTSSSTAASPTSTKVTVSIPNGAGSVTTINFSPAKIKVVVGVNNTIVWVNNDPIPHTATSTSVPSGASSFDSNTFNQGQTFELTLTVPGTYKYICTLHPSWMIGEIVVVGS